MIRYRSDVLGNSRFDQGSSGLADPFTVDPIRRSGLLVLICATIIVAPWMISERAGTTVMLSIGWLAITGIVIGTPILIISLIEEGIVRVRRRMYPPISHLDLSPRVAHILARHGYESIASVQATSDTELLLLSNMDNRGVREIRRAIALWDYENWQRAGFPARGPEVEDS
jgi:hypothetical protein